MELQIKAQSSANVLDNPKFRNLRNFAKYHKVLFKKVLLRMLPLESILRLACSCKILRQLISSQAVVKSCI